MRSQYELRLSHAEAIRYRMPLKRAYRTARGTSTKAVNFIVQLTADSGHGVVTGVGECQPRHALTGDGGKDRAAAWAFVCAAIDQLRGETLNYVDRTGALDVVRDLMGKLEAIAAQHAVESNRDRPFRGTMLGIEVALLDVVAQALGLQLSELLGKRRDEVRISISTISSTAKLEEVDQKVIKQTRFPMTRVKGLGDVERDLELLETVAGANRSAGRDKPLWIDINEALDFDGGARFVREAVARMSSGVLPTSLVMEGMLPKAEVLRLPELQRLADEQCRELSDQLDLRVMPDEGLWDKSDVDRLNELGGCRAINIKAPKAGGLLASLELANAAVQANPDVHISLGGMLGTSDITAWALHNLARALPRVDYATTVPPSNVEARISEPLASYAERGSNIISSQQHVGLGTRLRREALQPYIEAEHVASAEQAAVPAAPREAYPSNVAGPRVGDSAPVRAPSELTHRQDVDSVVRRTLSTMRAAEIDSFLLERAVLARRLNTLRVSNVAFVAGVGDLSSYGVGFSYNMSNTTSKVGRVVSANREHTRALLQKLEIPVPEGRSFAIDDVSSACDYAKSLTYPVVIKSKIVGARADRVLHAWDEAGLEAAFAQVRSSQLDGDVVVEQRLSGVAFRALVAGNTAVSVLDSNGGNPVNEVPPEVISVAERAVRAVPGLGHATVELIQRGDSVAVVELHPNPVLWTHQFPRESSEADVAGKLVDSQLSGTYPELQATDQVAARVIVSGRIEGDSLESRIAELAQDLDVALSQPHGERHTYEVRGDLERVALFSSLVARGDGAPEFVETTRVTGLHGDEGAQGSVVARAEGSEMNRVALPHVERIANKAARDNHLLECEALRHGLETWRTDQRHFGAGRSGYNEQIGFVWTAGVQTSRVATTITGRKQLTRTFMQRANVAVPDGRKFGLRERDQAVEYAQEIGWPVVVKPEAGTGGRGVTTDIRSVGDLEDAVDVVANTQYKEFVVERHVSGAAYRFVVLRDRVLSVVFRRPASVVGDGTSSVAELAKRQNSMRENEQRLQVMPRPIDDHVLSTLSGQGLGLESVPDAGRRVFLSNVGSRSQGGDSFEVLDDTHPSLLEMAVRAVRSIPGLVYAGVDFLIADHRVSIDDQQVGVCEINSSPASGSHHFPLYGPARNISRALVADQSAQLGLPLDEPKDDLCLDIRIRGLVQGVGYRRWMVRLAEDFGVAGWTNNEPERDVVRAIVRGPAGPVAAIASLAIVGPRRARPALVQSRHFAGTPPLEGFTAV